MTPAKTEPHPLRSLLQVHVAVFLFGLSGLFGHLPLPAAVIVLGRTGFASLALGLWLGYRRAVWRPASGRDGLAFAGLGGLLAFHWYSFFAAVQLSTVAIALLTFSSFPAFVALLEPLFFGGRWRWQDGAIALVVLLGVALVVPQPLLTPAGWGPASLAAFWGLLSGLSFALLQLLNKGYRQRYSALTLAFYQNLFACLSLLLLTPVPAAAWQPTNLGLLLLLGVLCTAVAHTLFIESLATLRAQLASVISALEPVYGIGLAALLLGQWPTLQTLAGGLLIVGSTAAATYLEGRPPQSQV